MPQKFEVSCASCNLRELCLPAGLSAEDVERVENIVYARRRVKRGETLFNAGAQFSAVYAIRSGFFETSVLDGDGREQVTGFFMGGELVGLDGLGSGTYNGTAVALEDSEVCVLPYALIEEMSREVPALQRHLRTVLAREIVRDRRDAAARLDARRGAPRDVPAQSLQALRASRLLGLRLPPAHDARGLGSYLGLKLETVSRLFSQFQTERLIDVQQKHVRILDVPGLERSARALE